MKKVIGSLAAGVLAAGTVSILPAQAAAPGTPEYTFAINRIIMYMTGVYDDSYYSYSSAQPMEIGDAIACAYADARPVSSSVVYAWGRAANTNYSWDAGGNMAGKAVESDNDEHISWTYTWDGGYLTQISEDQVYHYNLGDRDLVSGAALQYQIGADARPLAMAAPGLSDDDSVAAQRIYSFTYDDSGRIAAVNVLVDDPWSGQYTVSSTYAYNANGTLHRITNFDSEGAIDSFNLFQYDAQGKLTMSWDEEQALADDTAAIYQYDEAGRPVLSFGYANGTLDYQRVMNYQ